MFCAVRMKIAVTSTSVVKAGRPGQASLGSLLKPVAARTGGHSLSLNHYCSNSNDGERLSFKRALLSYVNMDWIISSVDALSDVPRWYVGAILGTGFFTYYLREVVKVRI